MCTNYSSVEADFLLTWHCELLQEARTGGADDDEEAKVGLSANASVMGWLDVVESPIASPKERQIALKSLARFSSVPDDCEAIVEASPA